MLIYQDIIHTPPPIKKSQFIKQRTQIGKANQHYHAYDDVPFYRKQYFFWFIFLFNPLIALVILLTGDIFYKRKGEVKAFGLANRIVAGIMLLSWLINTLDNFR